VISEAIVAGTPVIASRIEGNVGLLGEDYPGYFDVGGTRELARLLLRAETDASFLAELKERSQEKATLFDPANERNAWSSLLREVNSPEE
jgi:glycosyltransferase involved in cell wall biosynthesis